MRSNAEGHSTDSQRLELEMALLKMVLPFWRLLVVWVALTSAVSQLVDLETLTPGWLLPQRSH